MSKQKTAQSIIRKFVRKLYITPVATFSDPRANGFVGIKVSTWSHSLTLSQMAALARSLNRNGYVVKSIKNTSSGKWSSPYYAGIRVTVKKK